MRSLLIIAILSGCGFTLRHSGNVQADIGPDFVGAAKFCDDRYGAGTAEAESCFQDYRDYTKIRVVLDIQAIQDFCNKNYTDSVAQAKCVSDVAQAFDTILGQHAAK